LTGIKRFLAHPYLFKQRTLAPIHEGKYLNRCSFYVLDGSRFGYWFVFIVSTVNGSCRCTIIQRPFIFTTLIQLTITYCLGAFRYIWNIGRKVEIKTIPLYTFNFIHIACVVTVLFLQNITYFGTFLFVTSNRSLVFPRHVMSFTAFIYK